MLKTKIKKAIAVVWIMALASSTFAATQIGTGSVVTDSSFDSPINWDETFNGTANASGSVTWIIVKARIDPSLNMAISGTGIDLGTLTPWVVSSWSLDLEIWTNAASWVNVTVSSASWALVNTSDNSTIINSTHTWESYKFKSALNDTTDSSYSAAEINRTANLDQEITDSSEQTIYTTSKPERTDWVNDVKFTVEAKATEETPAWEYQDTLTFTVIGNI